MSDSSSRSKTLLVVSPDPYLTTKLDAKLEAECAADYTPERWTLCLVPVNLVAAFVREEQPDIMLVDADAATAHDRDALRVLRDATIDLPLVAVRELGGSADADDALLRAGVHEIVDHPFDADVVLSAVFRRAIARHAAFRAFSAAAHAADGAAAESAENARRRLRIVMHELVTPLTAIRLGTAALIARLPAAFEGDEELDTIARAAELMQNVLRDLHAEHALGTGGAALARELVSLQGVIDTVQQLLAPFAARRRLVFTCSCGIGVPRVHGDPSRLLQVLTNLVGNAIKFTSPGGRVNLSARAVQVTDGGPSFSAYTGVPAVRVAVEDTGVGIPRDELPHVFEWFWHSRNVARGGAGLGLAIAKMFVDAHGSRLNVESVAGRGTTFWFDLPGAEWPATGEEPA
jgi:signal transduction histidine kinase